MQGSGDRVLVMMSGGVDSSAAAASLLRQGYDVMGATLLLWQGGAGKDGRTPEPEYLNDARQAADHLNIPHYVLDCRESFRDLIIKLFIDEYARGRTPNPCVICNPRIKFDAALGLADELGARFIATGHYVRIARDNRGRCYIRRGADPSRDQSYFMYRIPVEILPRVLFPIGSMTKDDVRRLAAGLGLATAFKRDSQEVCFVPDGDVAAFLDENIPPDSRKPGPIVTGDGKMLGEHGGIHAYTIGQRRGLGIAVGRPMYVTWINRKSGALVVGNNKDLYSRDMTVTGVRWATDPPGKRPLESMVRIRYRHREAPAMITASGKGVTVKFDTPQRAITPGQSAVFYRGEQVLGGGFIDDLA